ncbi:MAG: hypothetical protein JNM83_16105 [Myxococcales bacterium]|jgi:hypothetical protein|nr:hypothetical protein [Myxococcales bacterium]
MGATWTLYVGQHEICAGKYDVLPLIFTIFRDNERITERVLKEDSSEEEEDSDRIKYLYKTKVQHVIARLDLMAFTHTKAVNIFHDKDNGIESNILFEKLQACYDKQFTFDDWKFLVSEIIKRKIQPLIFPGDVTSLPTNLPKGVLTLVELSSYSGSFFNTWCFPDSDYRYYLRVFLELFDKDEDVILDYSEQIQGHYYEPEDNLVEDSVAILSSGVTENSPIIVLTEGPSDIEILKTSIEVLYPHLSGYFYFLDLNLPFNEKRRLDLGAKMLARQVESFISAKIQNRIIALFDNDIAGWDACGHLVKEKLPENLRVFPLPDLEFTQNYPIKNNGTIEICDINRKGCSIELYLGKNIISKKGNNNDFMPLKVSNENWNLDEAQKTLIRRRFLSALQSRKNANRRPHDWSGIESILQMIMTAFHS